MQPTAARQCVIHCQQASYHRQLPSGINMQQFEKIHFSMHAAKNFRVIASEIKLQMLEAAG